MPVDILIYFGLSILINLCVKARNEASYERLTLIPILYSVPFVSFLIGFLILNGQYYTDIRFFAIESLLFSIGLAGFARFFWITYKKIDSRYRARSQFLTNHRRAVAFAAGFCGTCVAALFWVIALNVGLRS